MTEAQAGGLLDAAGRLKRSLCSELTGSLSPLSVLAAPAGFGKTVVLEQLAENLSESALFRCLPEDRSEEAMRAHLARAFPGGTLPQILLLDDFGLVGDSEGGRILEQMVCYAACCRVILACRTVPAFLSRLVLDGRCALLRADRLRMSEAEVRGLAESTGCAETAEELFRLTQGWPAGLDILVHRSAEKDACLEGYVRREIVEPMPPELRLAAAQAAVLGEFTPRLFASAAGDPFPGETLAELEKQGVGTNRDGNFSVLPLIGVPLRRLLPAQERSALTERAVAFCTAKKDAALAVRYAVNGRSAAASVRLLKNHGAAFLAGGDFSLIRGCLDVIDETSVPLDPETYGILGEYFYRSGETERMEYCFNMADSAFGKENRYSIYRSLYKSLLQYGRDPELYGGLLHSAMLYLKEFNCPLPSLSGDDREKLDSILAASRPAQSPEKPISVREFGRFQVTAGPEHREIPWRTRKGCELFAYLVSLGGGEVNRSELFNILWPDELPNNGVAMLHNMIYHIRRELANFGLDNVILYQNRRYSLDMSFIRRENEAVDRACAAVRTHDTAALLELRDAFSQNCGAYLENIDAVWATEKREYYSRCCRDACRMLAEYSVREKDDDRAAALYLRVLKTDPYSEKDAAELLRCYARLGRSDKIRAFYADFSAVLKRELGACPGEILRRLYENCVQQTAEGR